MSGKSTDRPRRPRPRGAIVAPDPLRLPSSAGFTQLVNPHRSQLPDSQHIAPPPSSSRRLDPAFSNPFASPQAGPTTNLGTQESALPDYEISHYPHGHPPQYSWSNSPPAPESISAPAPLRCFSREDLALLRGGYISAYVPPAVTSTAASATVSATDSTVESAAVVRAPRRKSVRFNMAEPRARAARHKGQMNFGPESKPTSTILSYSKN
jgi:hypothetical protein